MVEVRKKKGNRSKGKKKSNSRVRRRRKVEEQQGDGWRGGTGGGFDGSVLVDAGDGAVALVDGDG